MSSPLVTRLITALRQRWASKQTLSRNTESGFSLIEIMIVVAIIGIIMGGAIYMTMNYFEKSKRQMTITTMRSIQQAMLSWSIEGTGTDCPASLEELETRKLIPKNTKDGWGKPFVSFVCPGQHDSSVDIVSAGKDGKEGTEDDIRSWELK